MINLVYNEMLKLAGKKKMLVIMIVIGILVSLFTYAHYRQEQENRRIYEGLDWRAVVEQRIAGWESRINNPSTSEATRDTLSIRVIQHQYYLDYDVNPSEMSAPSFLRDIVDNGSTLLLPLLIMVIAADMVSSEYSGGTVKMLLTRPISRWRILLSKYIALVLSVSLILAVFALLSTLISGGVFGFRGWTTPVLTGFAVEGGGVGTAVVRFIPQWQFIFMQLGLTWFVCLVVATISFMLSVLVRSTAAGMGIMLAFLISGMLLERMVAEWESAKYLFMVNLNVMAYLKNQTPPIDSMTLGFSLLVLLAWAAAALTTAFYTFTRKDIY